ncbi:MAG: prolipoprotein diacylglyceryl transferase [Nitrospirae bacterium]|nr:prolipoprotein diacylglyceryl transferase [Nitrospirota bacterium]
MSNFIDFWQHIPENLKPYIFQIGQFQVRYYGLMYIAAFATLYLLSLHRLNKENFSYTKTDIENYLVGAVAGLLVGARLGYVLFYNFSYYMSNPLEIILPFSFTGGFHFTGLAGMSYHGGLIGVITASAIFCRKYKINFWQLGDFLVPSIPLGYTFGRMGNFINGELYGRATTVPWGMYFPLDETRQLRHPSQLYEALFEGIFLFLVLWNIRGRKKFSGFYLSVYFIGYGLVRLLIEFVRDPDPQLGLFFGFISMGQILCLCMILTGAGIFFLRKNRSQML